MVKESPGAIPEKHFNKFPLSWTLLAYGEAYSAAQAAENVFTEAKATADDITRIIKSWSRSNDDASVLLILESYIKTIQNGKTAPMSAAGIQIVAACFALINAQDLDEMGLRVDSEGFFLLRRFGAVIERAKLLSQTGESLSMAQPGALSLPSAKEVEKIKREALSEMGRNAANKRHDAPGGARDLKRTAWELFLSGDYGTKKDGAAEKIAGIVGKSYSVTRRYLQGSAPADLTSKA